MKKDKKTRTLALIVIVLLPIWIDEICRQYPEGYYCNTLLPYLSHPEPVSPQNIPYMQNSFLYGGTASTASTTAVPSPSIEIPSKL